MFNKLRTIGAIAGFVILLILTITFWIRYVNIDKGMELIELNNQAKIIATDKFFSQLESIGKISLTLLGVLWAFVIYKASRVKIQGIAKVCLFLQSNIFLLASFCAYFKGENLLIRRIFYHATIDLEAPIVNFWLLMQRQYFIWGLVWSVLTIILSLEFNNEER